MNLEKNLMKITSEIPPSWNLPSEEISRDNGFVRVRGPFANHFQLSQLLWVYSLPSMPQVRQKLAFSHGIFLAFASPKRGRDEFWH